MPETSKVEDVLMIGQIVSSECCNIMQFMIYLKSQKDGYECSACGCKVALPADRRPGCGAEMTGRQRRDHDWTEDAAFLEIITGRM